MPDLVVTSWCVQTEKALLGYHPLPLYRALREEAMV